MPEAIVRLTARASGRVQGVGFRYHVVDVAERVGVTGWTRNCDDGSVEVVAEGQREPLDQLLALIRRGPPGADVTGLEFEIAEATGEFRGFRVRY